MILTWCSNIKKEQEIFYKCFFNSLNKVFKGYTVILSDEDIPFLKNFNIILHKVEPIKNILTDRHFAFWNYLCDHSYDRILIADSRDIIFQSNPFDKFVSFDKKLLFTSEGFIHKESAFNSCEQYNIQQLVGIFDHNFFESEVINGGVIIGYEPYVRNFCFSLWSNCIRYPGVTDQAVVNHLIKYLLRDKDYGFSDPHKDNFCITGEAIKNKLISFEEKDNFICNKDNKRYSIFHQWDRTEVAEKIVFSYSQ